MSNTSSIITDYKVGLKQGVEAALQNMFGPNYPDPNIAGNVRVSLEFPMEEVMYPAVYITYSEGPIQNIGVGHAEYTTDPQTGLPARILHYLFQGQLNFNILGRNPLERDYVSAGVLNTIAFGKDNPTLNPFYTALYNNAYVTLQVNTDDIMTSGESVSNVPWNSEGDDRLYSNMYRVNVIGEFANNPVTGELIEIESILTYPWRANDESPPGWAQST